MAHFMRLSVAAVCVLSLWTMPRLGLSQTARPGAATVTGGRTDLSPFLGLVTIGERPIEWWHLPEWASHREEGTVDRMKALFKRNRIHKAIQKSPEVCVQEVSDLVDRLLTRATTMTDRLRFRLEWLPFILRSAATSSRVKSWEQSILLALAGTATDETDSSRARHTDMDKTIDLCVKTFVNNFHAVSKGHIRLWVHTQTRDGHELRGASGGFRGHTSEVSGGVGIAAQMDLIRWDATDGSHPGALEVTFNLYGNSGLRPPESMKNWRASRSLYLFRDLPAENSIAQWISSAREKQVAPTGEMAAATEVNDLLERIVGSADRSAELSLHACTDGYGNAGTTQAAIARLQLAGKSTDLRPDAINPILGEGRFFPVVTASVAAILLDRVLIRMSRP